MSLVFAGMRRGWLALVGLSLVATACGEKEKDSSSISEASVTRFEVEPETIVEGDPAILRWSTSKAETIYLMENGIRVDEGDLPPQGELEVRPTRDTTYRLEAQDAKGLSVYKDLSVSVQPYGPPMIETFEASATTVQLGQPVMLTWKVNRATSIRIADGGGSLVTTSTEPEGSYEVRPNRATTYVLVASNRHGEVSAQVEVAIGSAPFVVLQFEEEEIDFEAEATLIWEVREGETILVSDPEGSILHEGPAEDGSVTFVARHSGAYRATVRGAGGETTHLAFLVVRPVIESFEIDGYTIPKPGEPAKAHWSVRGAETVRLFGGAQWMELDALSGSVDVVIPTGGVFVLRAIRGATTVEKDLALFVGELPVVRTLRAGPIVTAGKGQRGVATVDWEVEGAAKLILMVEPDGRIVDIADKNPRRDSVEVEFTQPGTVVLVASNGAGETIEIIPAPVDPVPDIDAFFAAPSRAGIGEMVQVHWETRNAARVVLEQDGVERQDVDPSKVVDHVDAGPISAETTFVLRAYNTLDFEFVSEPLVVPVGPPNIVSLGTRDGRSMYPVNSTVRVIWENDGGTTLTVTDVTDPDDEREVFRTTDVLEIRNGGFEVDMPASQQTVRYRVVVTNTSGSDEEILELMAVTGPIILDFTTDVEEVTVGGSVLFSWDVTTDASGNIPVLHLQDDLGNVYPVGDADPLKGSKRFNIMNPGDRVFTLTATATNPPPYQLTTDVKVWDIPVIEHLAATPEFAENEGDPVQIEWETSHDGAFVELYLVDRLTGEPEPTPVYASATPTGSTSINPTIAKPNVLFVVYNPLGARTTQLLRVGVSPATILEFKANGVEAPGTLDILWGDTVTLSWDTARATELSLDAGWGTTSMFDLRGRDTAADLGLQSAGDSGTALINFPTGFTFPYDGQVASLATATVDGWLSFNSGAGSSCCPSTLPSSTYSRIHVLPFWDDLHTSRSQPEGTVLWEYFAQPVPHIVVQWADMNFWSSSRQPSDLNFQAVLFETGEIEFRWGDMSSNPAAHAEGSTAVIGLHNRTGSKARFVSDRTQVQGGLSGKSYFFFPDSLPLSGTRVIAPGSTMTYTLRAWNGHSEHEMEVEIRVHPKATLRAWAEPAEPLPGQPVTLHWEGENLTSLVIEDDAGNVVYTVPQGQLDSGSFPLGSLPMGDHFYKVRGVGAVAWDQLEEEIELLVYDAFSLDSFTASTELIEPTTPPTPVTLSWSAQNLTSAQIVTDSGGVIPIDPADLHGGSIEVSPPFTTTYTFVAESHGRYREASVTVLVRSVKIEDFQASSLIVPEGGTVTFSWSATPGARVRLEGHSAPVLDFVEVFDSPFEDISATGGVRFSTSHGGSSYTTIPFPSGFTFPFSGVAHTSVRAAGTGILTFSPTLSAWKYAHHPLPNPSEPDVHLAVLWGDLEGNGNANQGVYGKYVPGPDPHYIIQWKHWKPWGSSQTGDLNFQAVLYASGAIEYRYGSMTSTSGFADGGNVAIGLQRPGGVAGTLLHRSTSSTGITGGLANRSWRWDPWSFPTSGSYTATVPRSDSYELCVTDGHWMECETIDITVLYPGDLLISEIMVNPSGGASEQWFEVTNVGGGPIDLEGFEIRMGAQSHVIQDSIPLDRYRAAVLSRSSAPGFVPDYVYDPAMAFTLPSGNVALHFQGTKIAELSWTSSWTFPADTSLEIVAREIAPGTVTRSTASQYRATLTPYDGTNKGTPGLAGMEDTPHYLVEAFSDAPFIDIRQTGTRVTALEADGGRAQIPISFSMPFFGQPITDVVASSNGWIRFGSTSDSGHFAPSSLPRSSSATPAAPLFAVYWDDWGCSQSPDPMTFHWEERVIDNQNVLILQWSNYKRCGYVGGVTFQAQLWGNGDLVTVIGDIWTDGSNSANDYYSGIAAWSGLEPPGNPADHVTGHFRKALVQPGRAITYHHK